MKRFHWIGRLVLAGVLIAIGLFILLGEKEAFVKILTILVGSLALISGIISVATLSKYGFGKFNHNTVLIKSLLAIVVGVIAIIMPLTTAHTTWRLIIYVLAIQMAFSALVSFLEATAVRTLGFESSVFLQEAIVSLIISVVLFLFPSGIGKLVITILGVLVIASGLIVLTLAILKRPRKDSLLIENPEVEIIHEQEE